MKDIDDDTMMMESSPPPSSWMQDSATPAATQVEDLGEVYDPADSEVPLTHIVMVREEELKEAEAEFEEIHWIQIYSLQPASPADLHILSAPNDAISKSYLKSAVKDPTESLKGLGTIINTHAVWRDVQNAVSGVSKVVKPVATATTVTTRTVPTKPIPSLSRESSSKSKPISAPKGKASIMSSFAKTPKVEAKPKKEDATMKNTPNFSDDDDDDDDDEHDDIDESALRAAEEAATKAIASREAKAARKEKLDALMDSESDDDVEMSDAPAKSTTVIKNPPNRTSEDESDEVPEAIDDSAALDAQPRKDTAAEAAAAAAEEEKEPSTTTDGRRRGRRRVMKKRQFQDEDGYLVTKEEMTWESYSEDEPEVKREVKKQKQSVPLPAPAKKAAKTGSNKQGSLMSFFGKK